MINYYIEILAKHVGDHNSNIKNGNKSGFAIRTEGDNMTISCAWERAHPFPSLR